MYYNEDIVWVSEFFLLFWQSVLEELEWDLGVLGCGEADFTYPRLGCRKIDSNSLAELSYIWKFNFMWNAERDRHRRIFHPGVHSPDAHATVRLRQVEARNQELNLGSQVVQRDPRPGACLPVCIKRKLESGVGWDWGSDTSDVRCDIWASWALDRTLLPLCYV